MRKISIFFIFLFCTYLINAQTATWIGDNSGDWNDSGNWVWSDGSTGVPTSNDDIIITDDYLNELSIFNISVGCNNIHFTNVGGITYPTIAIGTNGNLEVYGDIDGDPSQGGEIYGNNSNGDPEPSAGITFKGNAEQFIDYMSIDVGKICINKTGGNVTINNGSFVGMSDSLLFKSNPVNISLPSFGNLINENFATLVISPAYYVQMPNYNASTQIPPHIISHDIYDIDSDWPEGLLILNMNGEEPGLDGTVLLPLGADEFSYNPISITDNSGGYVWTVAVRQGLQSDCAGNGFSTTASVQNSYIVQPINLEDGSMASNVFSPVSLALSFYNNNTGHDVLPPFNPDNNDIHIWQAQPNGCYNDLSEDSQIINGNMYTVSKQAITNFSSSTFVLSPQSAITVTTQDNVPAIINTPSGTLQMVATITPSSANQNVTWSIIPVSGSAAINNSGLVTAVSDGTVYAKGTSVADHSKSDSVLITISNQTTGIDKIAEAIGFKLYPNPVNDELYCSISKNHPALEMVITDAFGRKMAEKHFAANALNNSQSISVSSLASGMYFIHFTGDGLSFNTRFVKE